MPLHQFPAGKVLSQNLGAELETEIEGNSRFRGTCLRVSTLAQTLLFQTSYFQSTLGPEGATVSAGAQAASLQGVICTAEL